ncbi:OsmC family protein [Pontibacter sp. G13]|uniref:OsmC family protein n=1 Tax=Pontibacter sp. G13 TaxID=3074898 RepID=UPI00288C0E0B|nr:OsmC family protein [Pontibacter sp. G13]WNJ19186.1 OsmC family protein [Pontibacter sp. G13]
MKIHLKRINDAVHFEATNEAGNTLSIDGSPKVGGQNLGFRPMESLIAGLAGCSSIDICSILSKQRQVVENFEVDVQAERDPDHVPSLFTDIHLHVKLTGDLDPNKVERAVNLSLEKYCSVARILEKTAKITWSHEIIH